MNQTLFTLEPSQNYNVSIAQLETVFLANCNYHATVMLINFPANKYFYFIYIQQSLDLLETFILLLEVTPLISVGLVLSSTSHNLKTFRSPILPFVPIVLYTGELKTLS